MSRTVVINLGSGDLNQGFPQITVRLWTDQYPQAEQWVGSLPAAPELMESYHIWQSTYRALCNRLILRLPSSETLEDELEIEAGGITQVSQLSFEEFSQQLHQTINTWLKSAGLITIERQLRSLLNPADEIRVIFEANDDVLRRLPWHCWDFFQDYPYAEMALSRPEYQRRGVTRNLNYRQKVRILAILGELQGIDVAAERQLLQGLVDAEIELLVTPSRQEFNQQLWDASGWDILFFAGHSQTEGETGRIYLNDNPTNNSLTIAQLEEALKLAIDNGLKLAILNSCDGVGLAQALGKLQIPQVIVMREPVPNRVAQEFLRYFLAAFASERLPLYQAMRQTRRKLQGLEDEFPAASWLPVLCQNPAVEPSTWLQMGGMAPCPYRGLFAFQEADAALFFGREQVTNDLITAVKRQALVAVAGASGSGKSSVVFAGLVPRLRSSLSSTHWQILSFRPGSKPLDALAEAFIEFGVTSQGTLLKQPSVKATDDRSFHFSVLELAVDLQTDPQVLCHLIDRQHRANPGTRLLLIVDQFEELYTLCPEVDRQPFLDSLLDAVQSAPGFTLVLTLRADFYGYALSDRRLSDALQGVVYNLGPMNWEELQQAIVQPAAQMQVRLEPGLTDKLIQATWGQAGRLPLLEFALTELWSQQQAGWLTHQAYAAIGGVEEALANHAERVYAQLHPIDQQRIQRIFVQLVEPGVGTDASRRLATRDEVGETNWDLVSHLASARLVVTNRHETTGEETVEIVHEALIRSWGRLEHWLEMDEEFRRWQEELRRARRQWEKSNQEDEALLRGKRLSDAKDWYDTRQDELSSGEKQFIQRSLAVQEKEGKHRRRRRQTVISSLIAGLLAALMLAGFAWWGWQNAAISEVKAIVASSDTLFTSQKEFDALIEAIRSQRKLQQLVWADANTQDQALRVLQQAVFRSAEYNRLLPKQSDLVWSVAFSPDGNLIASASQDKTIHLWGADGQELNVFRGHVDRVWGVAFSSDSQLIVSGSEDRTIKLWNRNGREIHTLRGHADAVWAVAISPNSQLIASGSNDRTIKLWDRNGKELRTLRGHTGAVWAVTFSPDGKMIASSSDDGTVKLWSREGKELNTLRGHQGRVSGVAFSPDSQLIVSAGKDGSIRLWSQAGKEIRVLPGHGDAVWSVAFSPDGQTIASGSWDKTIKLWDLDGNLLTTLNGHTARVRGITFSPNGQTIASTSEDKTIRLWRIDNTLLKILNGHQKAVIGVSFSQSGQLIASTSDDNTVKLWARAGRLQRTLLHTSGVLGVAFSPDQRTLATAVSDGRINLWAVDGTLLQSFQGHPSSTWDVAFSPDGQLLASASGDHTIKLWTLDGKIIRTLNGHQGEVREVVFSPNGQMIASASFDRTLKLWKLDGTLIRTFNGHGDGVLGLAFSPDGQTIASASGDGSIKLWNQDGTLLSTLRGHVSAVWKVKFSPDGQTIASASEDKTVILWKRQQVQTLDPLKFGCNWIYDYLKSNPDISKSNRQLCDGVVAHS
ncbi:MAG: CHAT domain-containing protein [Kovacikia sp.]